MRTNPRLRRDSVRYEAGGLAGIPNRRPLGKLLISERIFQHFQKGENTNIIYKGHKSMSQRAFQSLFSDKPSRLCISPFVGSSRRMREVAMYSSRSVNQPLGRNQLFVCVGEGGILKNVAIPMRSVIAPSIRKSQLSMDEI